MKIIKIAFITMLMSAVLPEAATCYLAGDFNIIRTVPDPITNFDFSYLDITQSGRAPNIFWLSIGQGIQTTDCPATYKLTLEITSSLNVLLNKMVYKGVSGTFQIPSGGIRLSSTDFFQDNGNESPSITNVDEALSDEELQKLLLNSGTVPEGKLLFRFTLSSVAGTQYSKTIIHTLTIANIRYLRLITPGQDMSMPNRRWMEIFSPYPQFLWQSDLMSVRYTTPVKYVVSVYEAQEDIYSPANITSTEPLWVDTISELNFTQYPVSGVKPLLPGGRYYWQVVGILQGPVNSTIKSQLYGFQMGDLSLSQLSANQKEIMRCLELILGKDYSFVLKDLKGLKPEEEIVLDGKKITLQDLADIAKGFPQSKRTVIKARLR
jgi:hypothetical protein